MSSGSKSGKSANISSADTFSAIIFKMSLTRIRIPRIQGFPPHCPGIWVIRVNFWMGKDIQILVSFTLVFEID
jgi:hypothetical protein